VESEYTAHLFLVVDDQEERLRLRLLLVL